MSKTFHRDDELAMRLFYVLAWTAMIANTIGYLSNAILYGWTPSTVFSFVCALVMYVAGAAGFIWHTHKIPGFIILMICNFVEFPVMYCVYGSARIGYMFLGVVGVVLFLGREWRWVGAGVVIALDAALVLCRNLNLDAFLPYSQQENPIAAFMDFVIVSASITVMLVVLLHKYEMQQLQLQKRNLDIIEMVGTIVEFRSLESGEHIQRVKGYTQILAKAFAKLYPEYGLTKEQIDVIVAASALHDIGKIAIPDSILLKHGKLTDDEFEYMKSHTLRGCEILESMKKNWDEDYQKASYEICRSHHERYDGRGYPDGLKEDEIPVSAQLVSVADVYDALINERCYKAAFSKEEAFYMIINGECGVFSPKLMEAFRAVRRQFEEFSEKTVK